MGVYIVFKQGTIVVHSEGMLLKLQYRPLLVIYSVNVCSEKLKCVLVDDMLLPSAMQVPSHPMS